MQLLESRGVTLRVATEKLIAEEAPESYKDVSQVAPADQWTQSDLKTFTCPCVRISLLVVHDPHTFTTMTCQRCDGNSFVHKRMHIETGQVYNTPIHGNWF